MSNRLFLLLMIAAVSVAVIAGLWTVGGPMQGRRDKFDRHRYLELSKIADALLCEHRSSGTAVPLPEDLSVDAMRIHCSGAGIAEADLFDNETGAPYSYERMSEQDFSVCASFYDAERTRRLNASFRSVAPFDPETGCMSGRVR
ncbi:MAG: hypothetical protein QNJ20_06290 [Paracoccaceae bacterium]|nr:hypothetical protein [Paracoccaceae bacterium]